MKIKYFSYCHNDNQMGASMTNGTTYPVYGLVMDSPYVKISEKRSLMLTETEKLKALSLYNIAKNIKL